MDNIKVRLSKDGGFPINEELAGLVPMASDGEQATLTKDIRENSQREPIVLWHGEVVDGRCRQKALVTLNHNILYRELDTELTEEEVRVYVKTVNTRRNLTPTQKIMSACRASLSPESKPISQIAAAWGIGTTILKNARFIAQHRPEFVDPLFNGRAVKIEDSRGKKIDSNKITAIYSYVKKKVEEVVIDDTIHGWNPDGAIKTQLGKEWYYKTMSTIKDPTDRMVQQLVIELANYKYKYNEME